MLDFIKKHSVRLTESNVLLVTNEWINPESDSVLDLNSKWSSADAKYARKRIMYELASKRNETFRNQETLEIAKLFRKYAIYWPAVHD